jgi:hypothetical protein
MTADECDRLLIAFFFAPSASSSDRRESLRELRRVAWTGTPRQVLAEFLDEIETPPAVLADSEASDECLLAMAIDPGIAEHERLAAIGQLRHRPRAARLVRELLRDVLEPTQR